MMHNQVIAAVFVCSFLSLVSLGDSGVAIKGGAQFSDDPLTEDSEIIPRWEVEISSPSWFDQRLNLVGSIFAPRIEDNSFSNRWIVDETTMRQFIEEQLYIYDFRVGLSFRRQPKADVCPYISGGIGYFHSAEKTSIAETATVFDAKLGRDVTTIKSKTHNHDRSDEFYPWIAAGVEIPVENMAILAEVQYSAFMNYRGDDIGGIAVVAGVRWHF